MVVTYTDASQFCAGTTFLLALPHAHRGLGQVQQTHSNPLNLILPDLHGRAGSTGGSAVESRHVIPALFLATVRYLDDASRSVMLTAREIEQVCWPCLARALTRSMPSL